MRRILGSPVLAALGSFFIVSGFGFVFYGLFSPPSGRLIAFIGVMSGVTAAVVVGTLVMVTCAGSPLPLATSKPVSSEADNPAAILPRQRPRVQRWRVGLMLLGFVIFLLVVVFFVGMHAYDNGYRLGQQKGRQEEKAIAQRAASQLAATRAAGIPPRIGLAEFGRIEKGMTVRDVIGILGPGWEIGDHTLSEDAHGLHNCSVYVWTNDYMKGEQPAYSVHVTFWDDVVLRKDQDGLQ